MCRGARSAHGSPSTENRHSRRTPESRGKPRTGPRGSRPPMCSTPARAGKNGARLGLHRGPDAAPPHGPGRTPGAPPENSPGRDSPTTGHPPGSGPPPGPRREPEPHPNPAGDRPPPHRPLGHRSWRERVNDAIPHERRNRCAPESHAPTTFLSRRTARHWPDRASHPGEHVRKRQQGLRSHPPLRGAG